MSRYAVVSGSLPNAWPRVPYRPEYDIFCLTSVQWPGDLGMGVFCSIIMIICVENVYGSYGLKITD